MKSIYFKFVTTLKKWSESFLLEGGREDEKDEKSTDSIMGSCGVSKNDNEESTDVFDDTIEKHHHLQVRTKMHMSNPRFFIIWNWHGSFKYLRKNTQVEHAIFLIKNVFVLFIYS